MSDVEDRDSDTLAQDYSAMGDSVDLVNAVIGGTAMADDEAADRQDCVDRNVEHLELMKAKTDWGSESMTATTSAITAGKAYTAS
tara:strand:+ start:82 stop:336 length:255 start_codon:yes stop_codon:yes gene_type:complete